MLMSRRILLGAVVLVAVAVGVATLVRGPSNSAAPLARFNTLESANGAAIKGYDPVAYFVSSAAIRGKPELASEYGGVRWQFASVENKAKFDAEPERYLPLYGGYCAYGVAQGYLVKIDPEAWSIHGGKLYLNYDKGVQQQWEKDWMAFARAADEKWPKLVGKS